MSQRFVVVGLDHRHIYDLVRGLMDAGLSCAGYWTRTSDPHVLAGFRKRFPDLVAVDELDRLLEDRSAGIMVCAAIPSERAGLSVRAMRCGKDVLLDKPGVTSGAGLAALEQAVAETGRIVSVCFSERFLTPSTTVALRLIRDGAVGRVVQTAGFGPHRMNKPTRPAWFFEPAQYGGILADIASHQIDQFLTLTGSSDASIVTSTIGLVDDPRQPGFENFGEVLLRSDCATGYCRVDWFTPDGLPTWGDGRLIVMGTGGTIELRKYLDIEGRPGTDHLFLSDQSGTRYIECSAEPITYFRDFAADCRDRTETAMAQSHAFTLEQGAHRGSFRIST